MFCYTLVYHCVLKTKDTKEKHPTQNVELKMSSTFPWKRYVFENYIGMEFFLGFIGSTSRGQLKVAILDYFSCSHYFYVPTIFATSGKRF